MSGETNNDLHIVNTICNSHCDGTCEIRAHVRGGKIVRLEGGAEGPERRHRACAKGRAYRQRIYHPDRLLYPLKRTGARGSGEFSRISWEEALDTVANELKRVKEAYGNASILHFCSMCDPYTVNHVQAFHRLLCMFGGYTAPWGAISNEGQNFAAGATFGTRRPEREAEALSRARFVILWGWNPVTTHQGTEFNLSLFDAKGHGAKFVVIDARYSDSAATFADQWVPIRPGTDTAVLVALAYVIVTEGLHDRAFIAKWVFGFEEFCTYLFGAEDGVRKTPEWAEAISGVPASTIIQLARDYARTKPAIVAEGLAPGRTAFGEQFHRAVYALAAITGNCGPPEGPDDGVARLKRKAYVTPSPPNPVESTAPPRWNAIPSRSPSVNSSARVNVSSFADAVIRGKAGGYAADYRFLWLSNTNYLNQLGDVNRTAEAFGKLDFILVTEQFMTPTARFADVVLPVCTYFERHDLLAPGVGTAIPAYGLVNKVIEPLGESKSQLAICEALAGRLGIADYNDKTDEEWARFKVARLSELMAFPDYDTLKGQGLYWPQEDGTVDGAKQAQGAAKENAYPTPSGKIEIFSQIIAAMNHPLIPPLPKYIETWESYADPLTERYPLQLVTPHHKWRVHSQFDNLPWLRALESQAVTISERDATQRGIHDGDPVRVFNERGDMIIPCRVTERIMPGVVAIPQGAWFAPDKDGVDRGGCANALTMGVTSPGGAFASHTALVQVERIGKD